MRLGGIEPPASGLGGVEPRDSKTVA